MSDPAGRVQSADGTAITYWKTGEGPAVLLVHGTTSDHETFNEIAPGFAAERTVYTFDRRGRGESGDGNGSGYELEREFEDVRAVLARVAQEHGGPVDTFSHSFGAFVAPGAAMESDDMRSLVAYSPGFGAEYPDGSLERIETATASDDPDGALLVVFREVIQMPQDDIDRMRQSPVWQIRMAVANTIGRECRADATFMEKYGPALRELQLPVHVVSGSTNTPPKQRIATDLADLLPRSSFYEMQGQGHAAHHFAGPELSALSMRFYESLDGVGQAQSW